MESLHLLLQGFATALTPMNLVWAAVGVLLGTAIGVLPGIGPVATIAMLLPITYTLDPSAALIMLAGIYYGAQYGGSTTAILVNIPGDASAVITCLDGHKMATKGRAGAALGIAALGSFFAGCVATLVIAAFAPPLIQVAFKFQPAEYFSLMVLGLVGAIVLANGSLIKAFCMTLLGLLVGLIGTDRLQLPGSRMIRPVRFTVRVGEPLYFDKLGDQQTGKQRRETTETIMDRIAQLSGQPRKNEYNTSPSLDKDAGNDD